MSVCSAKTQISLGICPVFAVRMKKPWVLSYPLSTQRRLWSDWTDAQADQSLCWAHTHFVGFVLSGLISRLLKTLTYRQISFQNHNNPRIFQKKICWCCLNSANDVVCDDFRLRMKAPGNITLQKHQISRLMAKPKSEFSLGAHAILFVLSSGGSVYEQIQE